MGFAHKAAHIIGTYGLPLPQELLDALRLELRDSRSGDRCRLAEEEAGVFLARALHARVIAALPSGVDAGGLLAAWAKFTQQAMYRTDLGLINMVLFNHEILPLIDDVERILEERVPDRQSAPMDAAPGGPGLRQ
jgi:hypothetical protein